MWSEIASGVGSFVGGLFGGDSGVSSIVGGIGNMLGGMAKKKAEEDGIRSSVAGETPSVASSPDVEGTQAQGLLSKALRDTSSQIAEGMGSSVAQKAVSEVLGDSKQKTASELGRDTRAYMDNAFPELSPWEKAGAGGTMSGQAAGGVDSQAKLAEQGMRLEKYKADLQAKTQLKTAGIGAAASVANTKEQVYAQNARLDYDIKETVARTGKVLADTELSASQRAQSVALTIKTQLEQAGVEATTGQIKSLTREIEQRIQNNRYGDGRFTKEFTGVETILDASLQRVGLPSIDGLIDKAGDAWNSTRKFFDSGISQPTAPRPDIGVRTIPDTANWRK